MVATSSCSNRRSCTVGPSLSIVITISASATASAAVAGTSAPSALRACALAKVRFQAVNEKPAFNILRAIWLPIRPVPRKAIFKVEDIGLFRLI